MTTVCFLILIFVAALVQGMTGFGFGLFAVGLLPFLIPVKAVVPFVAFGTLLSVLHSLWALRGRVCPGVALPSLIGALLGTPVGILLLTRLDPRSVRLILGVTLAVFAAYSLGASRAPPSLRLGVRWGYAFGFAGGALGGSVGVGGPPVVIYACFQDWSKDVVKSVLLLNFALTAVLRIVLYSVKGLVTVEVLRFVAYAIPVLFTGTFLGHGLYERVPQAQFRRLLYALLLLIGVLQAVRSL